MTVTKRFLNYKYYLENERHTAKCRMCPSTHHSTKEQPQVADFEDLGPAKFSICGWQHQTTTF